MTDMRAGIERERERERERECVCERDIPDVSKSGIIQPSK
jgi:hypothetical protein